MLIGERRGADIASPSPRWRGARRRSLRGVSSHRHRNFSEHFSASYGLDINIFVASVRHDDRLPSFGSTNPALVKIHALSVLVSKLMRWMAAVAGFNGPGGACRAISIPEPANPAHDALLPAWRSSEHLNNNSFRCSSHDTIVRHLSTTQVSSPVRPK